MRYFACFSLEMSIHLFFFPFLFSGYFCSVGICVVCIDSSGCNQFSSALFCVMFSLLHRCIDAIFSVLFLLIFLTHTVCLRHLWDVRPYVSSLVFLFSRPFVEVLLSTDVRMVPSILRRGQLRYLSLCWDFLNVVFFRAVFLLKNSFLIYSFIFACWWCSLPVFLSFLFSECVLIFPLIWLFRSFRHLSYFTFHY